MENHTWQPALPRHLEGSSTRVSFLSFSFSSSFYLLFLSFLTSKFSFFLIIEHLGLIPPQDCQSRHEQVTAAMRPAPIPNEDETDSREDELVADPLADETLDLFDSTAKKNRAIFTEIFRPVPTNLVRDWKAYEVRCFLNFQIDINSNRLS